MAKLSATQRARLPARTVACPRSALADAKKETGTTDTGQGPWISESAFSKQGKGWQLSTDEFDRINRKATGPEGDEGDDWREELRSRVIGMESSQPGPISSRCLTPRPNATTMPRSLSRTESATTRSWAAPALPRSRLLMALKKHASPAIRSLRCHRETRSTSCESLDRTSGRPVEWRGLRDPDHRAESVGRGKARPRRARVHGTSLAAKS